VQGRHPGVDLLDRHDVALVRADNASAFTLTGTNTWVYGREPAYVVDPGPLLEPHLDAVLAEAARRGGVGGIAVTHGHADHVEALDALVERAGGVPVARDGELGPLRAVPVPGHSPDHVAWVAGPVVFTGDAVLGEGSVFLWPDPGALRGYLAALDGLRGTGLELLAPGHGPPVADPDAKLTEYIEHRLDRERRLVAALDAGRRSVEELLDDAWSEVPDMLRPAAAVTLAAHLDKLAEEGRLPDGVERPTLPEYFSAP
jgi:glyoxylase-like metal-dependent hydrolase (beta-lactamase superfamily II)